MPTQTVLQKSKRKAKNTNETTNTKRRKTTNTTNTSSTQSPGTHIFRPLTEHQHLHNQPIPGLTGDTRVRILTGHNEYNYVRVKDLWPGSVVFTKVGIRQVVRVVKTANWTGSHLSVYFGRDGWITATPRQLFYPYFEHHRDERFYNESSGSYKWVSAEDLRPVYDGITMTDIYSVQLGECACHDCRHANQRDVHSMLVTTSGGVAIWAATMLQLDEPPPQRNTPQRTNEHHNEAAGPESTGTTRDQQQQQRRHTRKRKKPAVPQKSRLPIPHPSPHDSWPRIHTLPPPTEFCDCRTLRIHDRNTTRDLIMWIRDISPTPSPGPVAGGSWSYFDPRVVVGVHPMDGGWARCFRCWRLMCGVVSEGDAWEEEEGAQVQVQEQEQESETEVETETEEDIESGAVFEFRAGTETRLDPRLAAVEEKAEEPGRPYQQHYQKQQQRQQKRKRNKNKHRARPPPPPPPTMIPLVLPGPPTILRRVLAEGERVPLASELPIGSVIPCQVVLDAMAEGENGAEGVREMQGGEEPLLRDEERGRGRGSEEDG